MDFDLSRSTSVVTGNENAETKVVVVVAIVVAAAG